MTTDYMSDDELFEEVYRQWESVYPYSLRRAEAFLHTSFKSKAQSVYHHPKDGNRWMMLLKIRKKPGKRADCGCTFVCLHRDGKGRIWALVPYERTCRKLLKFMPHFFSRETQRNLESKYAPATHIVDEDGSLNAIRHFFVRNSYYFIEAQDKPGVDQCACAGERLYVSMPDGVGCGEASTGRVALVKTFISYEQAYEDQELKFLHGEEYCKMQVFAHEGYSFAGQYRLLLELSREGIALWNQLGKLLQEIDPFNIGEGNKQRIKEDGERICCLLSAIDNGLKQEKDDSARRIKMAMKPVRAKIPVPDFMKAARLLLELSAVYFQKKYDADVEARKERAAERTRREKEVCGKKYGTFPKNADSHYLKR